MLNIQLTESVEDPSEGGQPLGAATSGQNTEEDLGQAHARLQSVHGNPVVARHRHLQSAAQARALDSRHHGLARGLHLEQQILAALGQGGGLLRGLAAGQHVDVGTGDEAAGLAGHEDRGLRGPIGHELLETFLQILAGLHPE